MPSHSPHSWTRVIVAGGAAWLVCLCAVVPSRAAGPVQAAAAQAGAGSTVWSGAYTEAQAKRGEETANDYCVPCHAMELAGSDNAPPLTGPEFLGNWEGQSAFDLFNQIYKLMPADAPGSLSIDQTVDLEAYIFQLNKFPAGEKELPTEMAALDQITIQTNPPAK